jgi:CBS domain-containing protein
MATMTGNRPFSNGNGNGHEARNPATDTREARPDDSRREQPSGRVGGRRWKRGVSRARDIMTKNPRTVRPGDSVQQVAQIMVDEDCGIVPVTESDGRLLGVITDRDIVCRLVARGIDMKEARARDVMTEDVECVTEEESLCAVLRLMSEHQVRRIPVVARDDRLMGIIAMADLAREADVDEDLQDTFEDISSERAFWSRLR